MIRNGDLIFLHDSVAPSGAAPADHASDAATPPQPSPANDPRTGVPRRPFAARPGIGLGVRALPLDGFVWGQHGIARRPRVRGDAVLLIVVAGQMRIDLPARQLRFDDGVLIYIPPGTAFSALPSPDAAGHALLIPAPVVPQMGAGMPPTLAAGRIEPEAFAALITHISAIDRLGRSPDPRDGQAALMRLGLISVALTTMAPADGRPARLPPALPREPRDLLDAFAELAGRELGRGRTISDLAQAIGTTTAQLDRACHIMRGCSALDLVYELRMARAIAALRDTARPPADIARELGFTGIAHMTRCFIAATGRPPEDFRHGLGVAIPPPPTAPGTD